MRKPRITRKDMIFDGFAVSDYLVIEKIERGSVIDVASFFKSIPGRNGQIMMGNKRNAKTITVKGRLFPFGAEYHEVEKTASLIASKLYTDTPKELILRDSILTEKAILDGAMAIERKFDIAEITMRFANLTGLKYGQKHSAEIKSGETLTLFNAGTEDADLYIHGETTNASAEIKNVKTAESMRFVALAMNEQITIDSEARICTGLTARKGLTFDSVWLKIHPGENIINATGLTATLEWRDTWM